MSTNNTDQPISLREKGELNFKDTAIKFGIITGLVSIILSLIFYFINVEYDSWSRYVSILISMILVQIHFEVLKSQSNLPVDVMIPALMKIKLPNLVKKHAL